MELANLKVLIVDDNEINRKLLSMYLNKLNIKADHAENGNDAIKSCTENFYDLVFMDVYMPGKDGIEATKEIRLMLGASAPTIIAITANAFSSDREACIDAGMKDFLVKPITKDGLNGILEKYFSNH